MKRIPPLLLAFVLAAGAPGSSPKLLFKSGFEDTWLDPVSGAAHNRWPRLRGTDYTSGLTWDSPPFDGTQFTLLQTVTSDNSIPAPGSITDYIQNTIETVVGPYNYPIRALKMRIIKPSPNTCCTQDTFLISGLTAPLPDVYVAYWIKLNPDILAQMQAQGKSYWRMLFEMKTATDYRIQTNIHWDSGPYFHAHADNGGLSGPSRVVWQWEANNTTVPVPLGQWFYAEFYVHRASDNTGRFFWGVNGQTIVDHWGPNYGANLEEVSALMFTNLYGPNPNEWYQWLADFELWDLPPCSSLPCGPPDGLP